MGVATEGYTLFIEAAPMDVDTTGVAALGGAGCDDVVGLNDERRFCAEDFLRIFGRAAVSTGTVN